MAKPYTNENSTRNGRILRTARFDLRCKPQVYARVWKMFTQFKKVLGKPEACCADVFEDFCLMLLEHCARELKINGRNMQLVLKLARPLPKLEWLKAKKAVARGGVGDVLQGNQGEGVHPPRTQGRRAR